MTRTEISRHLRSHRRALVLAAEQAIRNSYAHPQGDAAFPPSKTQFSRLVNLCNEATCAEELENYLRYQAARKHGKADAWRMPFVDLVLAGISPALVELSDSVGSDEAQRDLLRVEAWRLYATYLARAFTYEDAKRKNQRNQQRDKGHHGQRNRNHG